MDPADLFDTGDEVPERERDHFRSLAAIAVAVFAAFLAIGSVGGGNASDDTLQAALAANDAYAFFQAKNIRQTDYKIAADDLRTRLADPAETMSPETRTTLQQRLADYDATVARYESEPDPSDPTNPLKGEGKKELLAQAQAAVTARDQADGKGNLFDLGSAALQIAIVLMSVAILVTRRSLAAVAIVAGVVGGVLVLDGFAYLVAWPF